MVLPAGLSPATTTFEASHSDILSYGSVEIGGSPRIRTVLCGLRDRCIAAMLATLMPVRKDRDTKADLNRRSQVCEALPAPVFASRKMVRTAGNAPAYSCSRSKRLTFR